MSKRRDCISLKTRLAAALCSMLRPDESRTMVPVIDHESAKQMTEDQVLSLFPLRSLADPKGPRWAGCALEPDAAPDHGASQEDGGDRRPAAGQDQSGGLSGR